MVQKEKSKTGRKPLDIDEKLVYRMATIHCTTQEIASVCGCSPDTLERRFAGIMQQGRDQGKMSLKRKMFELALDGNVTLLLWLSKQHLGYREPKNEEDGQQVHFNVQINEVPV